MELRNGMLLRRGELASARRRLATLTVRQVFDAGELSKLIRERIAMVAKELADAEGPENIRTAYVRQQALVVIFERLMAYDGNVEHEIRRVLDHPGSKEQFFVLVSHA
ncbi:hypothetical protein HOI83_04230 [Candidatus Uhrbacteria bacterium]|jgi:hypothetical protein|nr:hypothetical protein [Candidatus Uhrbacteria bacterium]